MLSNSSNCIAQDLPKLKTQQRKKPLWCEKRKAETNTPYVMRAEKHFRPGKSQLAFACKNKTRIRIRREGSREKHIEQSCRTARTVVELLTAKDGGGWSGECESGQVRGWKAKSALESQVENFIYLKRPWSFPEQLKTKNRITSENAMGTAPVGCPPTHDCPVPYLQQPLATSNHENETFLIHSLVLSRPLACIILVNVRETLLRDPDQANGEVLGDDWKIRHAPCPTQMFWPQATTCCCLSRRTSLLLPLLVPCQLVLLLFLLLWLILAAHYWNYLWMPTRLRAPSLLSPIPCAAIDR